MPLIAVFAAVTLTQFAGALRPDMATGGGSTFGQRQPPLYVSIQKILDKYPDGQIFKVSVLSEVASLVGRSTITLLAGIYS